MSECQTMSPAIGSRKGAPASATGRRITAILSVGAVTTGLVAGLLYAFVCAVMPALSHVDDRTFVDVMQHINVSIENPLFFATFLSAPALTVAALLVVRRTDDRAALPSIVAALVFTVVELGVTGVVSIPLNNTLRDAGAPGAIADLSRVRHDFEGTWVQWNAVRAVAATAACASLIRALVLHARATGRRGRT